MQKIKSILEGVAIVGTIQSTTTTQFQNCVAFQMHPGDSLRLLSDLPNLETLTLFRVTLVLN